nr:MAG TPA: hypothetical protein [Caudoviricetes sp.]
MMYNYFVQTVFPFSISLTVFSPSDRNAREQVFPDSSSISR